MIYALPVSYKQKNTQDKIECTQNISGIYYRPPVKHKV